MTDTDDPPVDPVRYCCFCGTDLSKGQHGTAVERRGEDAVVICRITLPVNPLGTQRWSRMLYGVNE